MWQVARRSFALLQLSDEGSHINSHAPMEHPSHRPEPDHRGGRRCTSYAIRGASKHIQELQDVLHHHELLVEQEQIQEG